MKKQQHTVDNNDSYFEVSVIMPVYNAGDYVRAAVESALALDEVGEVILIEDGSRDHSLQVCQKLTSEYPEVKLFWHEGNLNKGAAASRNRGITESSYPFIAFLDADDLYTKDRFTEDASLFRDESIDITSHATIDFEGEPTSIVEDSVQYIRFHAPQKEFWKYQSPTGHGGTFHTNTITVRKRSIQGMKWFDERLRLSQDTEFWIRLGLTRKVAVGSRNIAALIRVHPGNRSKDLKKMKINRVRLYAVLIDNIRNLSVNTRAKALISFFFIIHLVKNLSNFNAYSTDFKKLITYNIPYSIVNTFLCLPFVVRYFSQVRPNTKINNSSLNTIISYHG